jgi:outer membrane protein OmpA-like peptidoglycan-associated protein
MGSQDDDNMGVVLGVVFGMIALVIALVVGVSQYSINQRAAKPAATVAAPAAADGASVKVEGGVVKFYFASGKADLAAGGNEALADIVRAVAAGKKAVISGFHDATGDAAMNAELAKQRALKVRDALAALGVAQDKVDLKKPEQTLATGSDSEARRVEVAVQ